MQLRILLPKGRMQKGVTGLLNRCGLSFMAEERSYRPVCSRSDIEVKLLKPQNIPELVQLGRHHCGFTGLDWIRERSADVVQLLDLGLDRARLVYALPEESDGSEVRVVASEYMRLSEEYLSGKSPEMILIRSWGATEALPPDDADAVIDVVSSGTTLRMNRLREEDCLMETSTMFIANRDIYQNCIQLREKIDVLVMLMKSCINAERRRLLEMNVPAESLEAVTEILPCMQSPTVAPLQGGSGFSVKAAVPLEDIPSLVPRLVSLGATDILESRMERILAGGESG